MNRSDINDCLVLSEASYLTRYQAQDLADTIGATLHATIHSGSAHCYMFKKDKTVYFASRGTDIKSLTNIIMDAKFMPVWEPGFGFLHKGFLGWADLLWDEVGAYLVNDGFQAERVVFTGHSAGGAVSNILATRASGILKSTGRSKPITVTFGSPKVGTLGFSIVIGKMTDHYRVTNNNDPVAHVPIWPLFLHAPGQRYHILSTGEVVQNPSLMTLIRDVPGGVVHFAWNLLKNIIKMRSVLRAVIAGLRSHDHFVSNYRMYFK